VLAGRVQVAPDAVDFGAWIGRVQTTARVERIDTFAGVARQAREVFTNCWLCAASAAPCSVANQTLSSCA